MPNSKNDPRHCAAPQDRVSNPQMDQPTDRSAAPASPRAVPHCTSQPPMQHYSIVPRIPRPGIAATCMRRTGRSRAIYDVAMAYTPPSALTGKNKHPHGMISAHVYMQCTASRRTELRCSIDQPRNPKLNKFYEYVRIRVSQQKYAGTCPCLLQYFFEALREKNRARDVSGLRVLGVVLMHA